MHVLAQIRKARQSESGFTLIELLIVIVILGVLAGIVVFAVGGVTDRGQTAACKADLKTVSTAVEAYRAGHPAYPAAGTVSAAGVAGGGWTDLVPSFLHSAPVATVTLGAGGAVTGTGDCAGVTL
jgi:general secretion pathway protein G